MEGWKQHNMNEPFLAFPGQVILILLLLAGSVSLSAQIQNVKFEHLTIEDGLSHSSARDIAQDKQGPIEAPEDALLLMPLYQSQGEDGFFLIKKLEY